MDIIFELLESNTYAPMDLLLLADPSEVLIHKYLIDGLCYVAKYDSETIGVLLINYKEHDVVEIMNLAIDEKYQKRGIGKRFIKYVISEMKNRYVKTVEIGTGNPGVHQMLLYQKCGFRIIGVDLDFFRRKYPEKIYENGIECRDMIRMEMVLN